MTNPKSVSLDDLTEASVCQSCPVEAEACWGSTIMLKEGYWRNSNKTDSIFECPFHKESCIGGSYVGDDLCGEGYEGPLCAVCEDGYRFISATRKCEHCSDESSWVNPLTLVFGIFFIGFSIVLIIYIRSLRKRENINSIDEMIAYFWLQSFAKQDCVLDKEEKRRRLLGLSGQSKLVRKRISTRIKVHITFFQLVSILSLILYSGFPDTFSAIIAIINPFVNLSFMTGSFFASCSQDSSYDYIDGLYVSTLSPFFISFAIWLCCNVHTLKYRSRIDNPKVLNKVKRLHSTYFTLFLFYTYLILPALSVRILNVFVCKDIDPDNDDDEYFMVEDYSVSCSTSRYRNAYIYSIFMVMVYPVGIPAMYFCLLYSFREDIKMRFVPIDNPTDELSRDIRLSPLTSLFSTYKCEFWYWECLLTLYRLSVSAFLVVVGHSSNLHIILGTLFTLVFAKISEYYVPFLDHDIEIVYTISFYQIFFIFFSAMLIKGGFVKSEDGILIACLMIAVFTNVLVDLLRFLQYCYRWRYRQQVTNDEYSNDGRVEKVIVSPLRKNEVIFDNIPSNVEHISDVKEIPNTVNDSGKGKISSDIELT